MKTSLSYLRFLLWAGVIALGSSGFAQTIDDGLDANASEALINPERVSPEAELAALDAEQQFLVDIATTAAAGDEPRAWRALVRDLTKGGIRDGISVERLGWRVATVVGFLKNQGANHAACVFTQLALSGAWCRQTPSDELRYWCAQVSLDGINDEATALDWLGRARNGERPQNQRLRERIEAAEQARDNPTN